MSHRQVSGNGTGNTSSISSDDETLSSSSQKKIPPIKAPVGLAPPPDIKNVKAKVDTLANIKHKPGGGDKKIFQETPRYEYLHLRNHSKDKSSTTVPSGTEKRFSSPKLPTRLKEVKSKVGSLANIGHQPGGGKIKIFSEKLNFRENAEAKVGSLDNADHVPGGGNVEIIDEKYYYSKKTDQ
ncbi:microtubule-associated protein tau-like [Parasteatoda tepidariorum]|uniref:microtubule-associated protein tau-like n=1 Tax=Parasteatoda tepidariorum TaxID=114398 RepID=UPI001C725A87|nr:microtubule-associated protein tau-like [Parasteatoda tepidariorum]